MEPVGVYLKEDWESLNKMFSSNIDYQEADFALQFLQCPSSDGEANAKNDANNFDQDTFFYPSQNFNTNFYLSQESTAASATSASNFSVCFPTQSHENSHSLMNDNISDHLNPMMVNDNNISDDQLMNYYVLEGQINALTHFFPINDDMQDVISLKEGRGKDSLANADHNYTDFSLKRKFEVPQQPDQTTDVHHPKKKSRVPRNLPKDKRRIVQPKKNQKLIKNDEDSNGGPNGQSCSSYCSEDDSNASQELNGGASSDSKASAALNSSGKPRASRGAATDPQSLYARKRRERINERLRILQNLVPNGTKVDISTMLEEAVHYVKFLQLQIKLLSSDDMWMFAPIAYNGMDIGLYQKINS